MKIYAVGETILDIIFKGREPQTARPGGSSFNASITLGRLGAPINFISEMGDDRVGDLIQDFMEENGVTARYISRYPRGQSAIALAFLNAQHDAEYQFYKDYPSQRLAIEFPEFQKDDLLLFGSFYALNPGIRPRVKLLLDQASQAGASIVYDPNFRSTHLADRDHLVPVIRENMACAALVRASDEDLLHIFETEGPDEAWEEIRPYADALVYTASARGVYLRTSSHSFHMEVERIEPVSTIGAGDTFNAGLVYGLWKNRIGREEVQTMGRDTWQELIATAIEFSKQVCMSYDNYLPLAYVEQLKKNY